MASLLRIIIIIVLLILPFVAFDIFKANDIANTYTDFSENISLTKQSSYRHFLNDFPSNTGYIIKVTKTTTSFGELNMILLSEDTLDLFDNGEELKGHFVQKTIGSNESDGEMEVIFDVPLPLYIVIEYINGASNEIQLTLEIQIFYESFFFRQGITVISIGGIYIFSVIYINSKIQEFKTQRAILRYERKKMAQEDEFLDQLLGPLEDK